MTMKGERKGDVMSMASKTEEGGHESRDVGSLKKLKKAGKQILPESLQKGIELCQHLDFRSVRLPDFCPTEL